MSVLIRRVAQFAFGGMSLLEGNRLVRWAYLDESGISAKEPIAVVSGVLVEPDRQLIAIEEHLDGLKEKYIPPEARNDFWFHAKELWDGSGFFADRERWPLGLRLDMLRDLAAIPGAFGLPVMCGTAYKRDLISNIARGGDEITPPKKKNDWNIGFHVVAFMDCALSVESYMRENFPDEISTLLVEDNTDARATIKMVHEASRKPSEIVRHLKHNCLPFRKIREPVHFVDKRGSKCLQIADTCAFFIRSHFSGYARAQPFVRQFHHLIYPAQSELG